jgi:hypothetical protein
MQLKVLGLVAISCMALAGGCDAGPFSPRLRSAEQVPARTVEPAGLTASAVSANEIDLSWPDDSPNETGWQVHRATTGSGTVFALLATLAAGTTRYADTGLTQRTEYCYKVRSFRAGGHNTTYAPFSSTSCGTTLAMPQPPSNLIVRPDPDLYQVVTVTWSDNSPDELGFRIDRSASMDGLFEVVTTLGANATFYQDYYRTLEQQVCYRVVAFNGNGTSAPTSVRCTAPPNKPTNLTAQSFDSQSIALTWRDNSSVEDGYEVQRADGNFVNYVVVATLPANATTYRDASVTPNVQHSYRVRATKDGGFSSFTNYATAMSVTSLPASPLAWAVPYGSTAIMIYWSSTSINTEGARVERSLDGGSSWTTAGSSDAYAFIDTGRSSERQACYRVFAVNRLGESPASSISCTTPPAAATNFSVTMNADGSYDLHWTDNSVVEGGYVVLRVYNDGDGHVSVSEFASLPPNTESYRLLDPSPFMDYYYYISVVASKDGGYSDWAAPAIYSLWWGTAALRAAAPKDPRVASRADRGMIPFDARLSSLKKLPR